MMKTILPAPARLAAAFLAAALLSMSLAHAQERRERREHERERFQTPHWVFDDRFHHNHYYPAVGDRKSTRLNSSHVAISYAVFCLKKKKCILVNQSLHHIYAKPRVI